MTEAAANASKGVRNGLIDSSYSARSAGGRVGEMRLEEPADRGDVDEADGGVVGTDAVDEPGVPGVIGEGLAGARVEDVPARNRGCCR